MGATAVLRRQRRPQRRVRTDRPDHVHGRHRERVHVRLEHVAAVDTGPTRHAPTVALGAITIGTTSLPTTARIANVGALPVMVTSIVSDAPFEIIVVGHTCGVVAGGASCTVDLAFKPWIEGPRSTQIRVTSNGVGAPQAFVVTATAVAPSASAAPRSGCADAWRGRIRPGRVEPLFHHGDRR